MHPMFQYNTEKFNLNDDSILWEKFMCFVRVLIPYEEHLNCLSEIQKCPVIAFIYESEVWGDGHIGFMELYGDFIKISNVIDSLKMLSVAPRYIDNLNGLPNTYISTDKLCEQCADEEEFNEKMEEMGNLYEVFDENIYQFGNQEIIDKILNYIRHYDLEFFSYQ